MGLNIIAYRVLGTEQVEGWHGNTTTWIRTEDYKDFDSLRYSGDNAFVTETKFQRHPDDGEDFEERYYRPSDIEESKKWVMSSDEVPEGNKPRLIKLLEDMEKDPSIYLYFSR